MITENEQLWQLHVRAVQGETLSIEEQTRLEQWYAAQDQAEQAMIKLPVGVDSPLTFKAQVDELLARIATATLRIKRLTEENEILRQEIVNLRRQLTQRSIFQPA